MNDMSRRGFFRDAVIALTSLGLGGTRALQTPAIARAEVTEIIEDENFNEWRLGAPVDYVEEAEKSLAEERLSVPSEIAQQEAVKTGNKAIDCYFGCGCFWHVQHELVNAERYVLQRSDDKLSALAGYAGGK